MNDSPFLVVIGHTCIDINRTPTSEKTTNGGAGYFSALAASRLVNPVSLITRVGSDYDPTFLLSHVLLDGVHIVKDKPTMCSIQIYTSDTDFTDRDIQQIWGVGPDICPQDFPANWYTSVRHVHLATMPPAQQLSFINLVRNSMPQVTLSIDTDLFLVKIDKDGAYCLSHGQKVSSALAPVVQVADTTGAGDIFAGTYIASILNKKTIMQSLEAAVSTASQFVGPGGIKSLF